MTFIYGDYDKEGFGRFGVNFGPLRIFLRKKWATFTFFCLYFSSIGMIPLMPFVLWMMGYLLLYSQLRYFVILYIFWCIYDRNTPFTGGRKFTCVGRWYPSAREYFPAKLVKTVDLPPNTNYCFGAFPHGICCAGLITNFLLDVGFEEVFPALERHVISLGSFFWLPFVRETFLSGGVSASNKNNIMHHLNCPNKNKAVILMIGGAAECLLSRPGTNNVVINKRKGFVKLTLQAGVPLVPVYTFGENELICQIQSKWIKKFQEFVRKFTGIPPLMLKSIFPRSKPLISVVGKPIPVRKIENPTQSDINEYHAKFKEGLIELFETNKEKYDPNGKNAQLTCY